MRVRIYLYSYYEMFDSVQIANGQYGEIQNS